MVVEGGGEDGEDEGGFCEDGFKELVTAGAAAGTETYESCYALVLADSECANKAVFSYGTGSLAGITLDPGLRMR